MIRSYVWPAAAILLLTLAGCSVGPDFKRPDPPAVAGFTPEPPSAPGDQKLMIGAEVPATWWRLFRSPALDSLIGEALRANPDLKAAHAALRAAEENLRAQYGILVPAIQGGIDISRNKDATGSVAPTAASGSPSYSLIGAHLNISYAFDIFGANRRQTESTAAQADAQRYQAAGAAMTLISNVAMAAVQEASLRAQIEATERVVAIETDLLAVLRRQAALGEIAEADVVAEEAAVAQSRALLPALLQRLSQNRTALTVLLGRLPSDEPSAHFKLADLHLPEELPLSVPAGLIDHRPDVRAAEANLHAATAQVGVAVANMLPNITLTADTGSMATAARSLFAPGTGFWNLVAGLSQPIFQGGALLHRKHAAAALAEQAAAQYQSTVLAAFQGVCDALHAVEFDATTLHEAEAAESAAARSLDIVRRQLDVGQVSGLALLNAERTYDQALIVSIQSRAARISDVISLFHALGGGWTDRENLTRVNVDDHVDGR